MKRFAFSVIVALVVILALPALVDRAQDEPADEPEKEKKPKKPDAKALLEKAGKAVGGVWVEQAGIDDPNAPHGKFSSEWGINKKMLKGKTWWLQDGKDTLIYEGIQFWHPDEEKLMHYEVGFTGGIFDGASELKDGKWINKFTSYEGGKTVEYEQHGEYLNDNTMTSIVYVKQDGKLKKFREYKFYRKPKGWPNEDADEEKDDETEE